MEDSPTTSSELVDALNQGIIKSIQTSGDFLPSSAIQTSSPAQCQWTEYAIVDLQDDNGLAICSPVVEDLRQFFPPLDGSEPGSDGRPMLYAACLGLLLSKRDTTAIVGSESCGKSSPCSTFLSVAKFLLDDLEVDTNEPTRTNGACRRPPLHLAARSCHPSGVAVLLSHGADVNLPDDEGWTALMACCMPDIPPSEEGGPMIEERVETVKVLLKGPDSESGALNVNARNYCGYTALHYACEGLNSSLIQCLLEVGEADATLRTVWGQSCVGIVRSQCDVNEKKAAKCEAIILSHLEKTGKINEIRHFLEEEKKALDLVNLVNDVLIPASRRPEESGVETESTSDIGLSAQDKRIIIALMKHLNLDPSVLFQKASFGKFPHQIENLYEVIHRRIIKVMPKAFLRVYCNSNPSNEEREVVTCTNYSSRMAAENSVDGVRHIEPSILMSDSFCLHRERGHVARQVELLTDLIVGPLQRTIAFGIPSNGVAKKIVEHAPRIVEMGAGTGFWSYVLSSMGANVVAYDAYPPASLDEEILEEKDELSANNAYVGNRSYFSVQKGDASSVFDGSVPEMESRALLMVWPNNPDADDNKHVVENESNLPQIWDVECLQKYHELGGCAVIYVGEREKKIQQMSNATNSDCGFCASRKFQVFLQENFDMVAELECPRWWMKEDDVTVWKRK